jgi:hypothetical protein
VDVRIFEQPFEAAPTHWLQQPVVLGMLVLEVALVTVRDEVLGCLRFVELGRRQPVDVNAHAAIHRAATDVPIKRFSILK